MLQISLQGICNSCIFASLNSNLNIFKMATLLNDPYFIELLKDMAEFSKEKMVYDKQKAEAFKRTETYRNLSNEMSEVIGRKITKLIKLGNTEKQAVTKMNSFIKKNSYELNEESMKQALTNFKKCF